MIGIAVIVSQFATDDLIGTLIDGSVLNGADRIFHGNQLFPKATDTFHLYYPHGVSTLLLGRSSRMDFSSCEPRKRMCEIGIQISDVRHEVSLQRSCRDWLRG